jgi:LacI family transcriptional regulator
MADANIYDVAKQAGVGIGTVSRVLNNSPQVTPETRQRVLLAIKQLNFKPSNVARKLSRNQRLHNIGVITLSFASYYSFAERLRGVQTVLNEMDEPSYDVVLYSIHSMEHYSERLATIAEERPVEGLLIIDLGIDDAYKAALRERDLPFVGINHELNADWPSIVTDSVEGGRLATQHLIDLGHRRIAYIGDAFFDQFGFNTSQERHQGYQEALAAAGIPYRPEYVSLGPHGYDSARELIPALLALPEPPTAIFAMSDIQAMGCLSAVREAGKRVPEDIAIIGYDDLEISAHIGLSTVQQHLALSGAAAATHLLNLMQGNEGDPPALPPLKVIPRQTTVLRV